jgi:hypothetical protein
MAETGEIFRLVQRQARRSRGYDSRRGEIPQLSRMPIADESQMSLYCRRASSKAKRVPISSALNMKSMFFVSIAACGMDI